MIKFAITCSLLFLVAVIPVYSAGIASDGKSFEECVKNRRSGIKNDAQLRVAEAYCRSKHTVLSVLSIATDIDASRVRVKTQAETEQAKARVGKQARVKRRVRAVSKAGIEQQAKVLEQELAAEDALAEKAVAGEEALLTAAPVAEIESVELDEPLVDTQAQVDVSRIANEQKMQTEIRQLLEQAEQEEKEKIIQAQQNENEEIMKIEQKERDEIIQAGGKQGEERRDAEQKARTDRIQLEQKAREERIRAEQKAREERVDAEHKAMDEWIAVAQKSNEAIDKVVAQYKEKIIARIHRNIVKLPGASNKAAVKYDLILEPDGSVTSARLVKPSGSAAYDRMVERAIQQSQPLPLPSDPALFDKFRVLHVKVSTASPKK